MAAAGKGSLLETAFLSQLSHCVPEKAAPVPLILGYGPALDILHRHLTLVSRTVSGADLNNGELIVRRKGERSSFCFLKME